MTLAGCVEPETCASYLYTYTGKVYWVTLIFHERIFRWRSPRFEVGDFNPVWWRLKSNLSKKKKKTFFLRSLKTKVVPQAHILGPLSSLQINAAKS